VFELFFLRKITSFSFLPKFSAAKKASSESGWSFHFGKGFFSS
jgi:hypothetical protein